MSPDIVPSWSNFVPEVMIVMVGGYVRWVRSMIHRNERGLMSQREKMEALEVRIITLESSKDMLNRMYRELTELSKLTHKIAGHLGINA